MVKQNILKRLLIIFVIMMTIFPQPVKEAAIDQTIDLSERIDDILTNEHLHGSIVGVSVRHAETAELIYAHFGETRLRPASNMKILTSIAALETLGPGYKFTTEILIDGKVDNHTLDGNLYMKGYGDPTLLKGDLDQFAKEIKAYGIHTIKGNLIGDDSWYDDVRLSQDLNWSDESNYTGAQVSALTLSPNEDYDAGTVIVEVNPGKKIGNKAEVMIIPETDHVHLVNQIETVAKDDGSKEITIEREHGTNTINMTGTIPVDQPSSRSWVAVWEPTDYVLDVFKKSLKENGVQFVGGSQVRSAITPKGATVVTAKKSVPLSELLIPFMKLSNNGLGETLAKEMGKVVYDEGSWDKGLQVIEGVVKIFGVDTDTIVLRDGSGMSHKNMIPPNEMTKLLYHIQQRSWYPIFERSLPIAGAGDRLIGGTLRWRMTDQDMKGKVMAKTGTLTGVSTLSGFVATNSGEKLIFSIFINNFLDNDLTFIQDEIVKLLVRDDFN